MKCIRIFLADDHRIMNAGLAAMLSQDANLEVSGIFTSGAGLLERLLFEVPDLVISDISMPDMNGIELAKTIRGAYPNLKIMLLTMHASAPYVKQAQLAGVDGYVLKEAGLSELREAIQVVLRGEKYISLKAAASLMKEEQEGTRVTPRETEILKMLARGFTTKEIADVFFVSANTIDSHRKNLLAKTGVSNTAELIVWAVGQGHIMAGEENG